MSDNKKYYYLKLKENFFDSEEMKILTSMDNGYEYAYILLGMYLKSLKNEGQLIFQETIPYNPKMLSIVLNHNIDIVEKSIRIFKQLNLIETLESGEIFMSNIQSLIGQSSTEAERKQRYRDKIKMAKTLSQSGTMSHDCPEICPPKTKTETELKQKLDTTTVDVQQEIEELKLLLKDLGLTDKQAKDIYQSANGNMNYISYIYSYAKTQNIRNMIGWLKTMVKPGMFQVPKNHNISTFNNFEQRTTFDYDEFERQYFRYDDVESN